MATPTGPEFGFAIPLDTTSVICLGLGVVIVALHSMKKFEESTVDKSEDNFISQLLPRYLATREEYSRALMRYMGSMIGILCALSVLGPRLLEVLSPTLSAYAPVAPLGFALIFWSVFYPTSPGFRTSSGVCAGSGTNARSFLPGHVRRPTCFAPPISTFLHINRRRCSRPRTCGGSS